MVYPYLTRHLLYSNPDANNGPQLVGGVQNDQKWSKLVKMVKMVQMVLQSPPLSFLKTGGERGRGPPQRRLFGHGGGEGW